MFFWNSLAFSMIQWMLAIWSLVPLPFLKPAWTSGSSRFTYCWSLAWRFWAVINPSKVETLQISLIPPKIRVFLCLWFYRYSAPYWDRAQSSFTLQDYWEIGWVCVCVCVCLPICVHSFLRSVCKIKLTAASRLDRSLALNQCLVGTLLPYPFSWRVLYPNSNFIVGWENRSGLN